MTPAEIDLSEVPTQVLLAELKKRGTVEFRHPRVWLKCRDCDGGMFGVGCMTCRGEYGYWVEQDPEDDEDEDI